MKLDLVTREQCRDYIAQRFPEDSDLRHEDWKRHRDQIEKKLMKYGRIDRGVGTVGDFSVAADWFGTRMLHVCANSRKIISASVLGEIVRLIDSTEPEYGVTFVGTYPQVLLIWTIVLTRERQMIAFGPSFDDRMRDKDIDPEVGSWVKALDALWR